MLQMQGTTHPFAVVRFAELDHWVADGEYAEILAGNYLRREDDSDAKIGDEFLAAAKAYQESWSRSNDPFIGLVKGVAETAVGTGQSLFGNIFGPRSGGSGDDN